MTAAPPDLDPPCPTALAPRAGATDPPERPPAIPGSLRAVRRSFDDVDPATWDRLAAASPWATPFARWGVHRAWWDAYGANAHEQTLVVVDPAAADPDAPIAIVPLMHRHEVEQDDAILRTRLRGDARVALTAVAPTAKAVFFGATYHADYATLLARPADLPAVAEAVVDALATPSDAHDPDHPAPWDVVDLRRLRCGDPAASALAHAFGARAGAGWTVVLEREDVCPVVTFEPGADFEAYLGTLEKKERHEIRRKLRRAEAAGEVRLERASRPGRRPRRVRGPSPEALGRARALPPDPGRGPEPPLRAPPLRAPGRRRDLPAPLPGGGGPADRGRDLVRGRRRLVPLQRRRRPRGARAVARAS